MALIVIFSFVFAPVHTFIFIFFIYVFYAIFLNSYIWYYTYSILHIPNYDLVELVVGTKVLTNYLDVYKESFFIIFLKKKFIINIMFFYKFKRIHKKLRTKSLECKYLAIAILFLFQLL